jgi:hypothetical protein
MPSRSGNCGNWGLPWSMNNTDCAVQSSVVQCSVVQCSVVCAAISVFIVCVVIKVQQSQYLISHTHAHTYLVRVLLFGLHKLFVCFQRLRARMYAYVYMCKHEHLSYPRTLTHTHTHTCTHIHVHAHTHMHTCLSPQKNTQKGVSACPRGTVPSYAMLSSQYTCVYIYTHIHICAYIDIYTCTQSHTHTHTYIHTCMCRTPRVAGVLRLNTLIMLILVGALNFTTRELGL